MKFNTQKSNKIKSSIPRSWLIIAIVGMTLLWMSNLWLAFVLKSSNEIGDSFGIINSLFSGLAFAFLIYTTIMQKNELKMQREELQMQREEMKLTRQELRQSTEAHQKHVKLVELQIKNEEIKNKPYALVMCATTSLNRNQNQLNWIGFRTTRRDAYLKKVVIKQNENIGATEHKINENVYREALKIPVVLDSIEAGGSFTIWFMYDDVANYPYYLKVSVSIDTNRMNPKIWYDEEKQGIPKLQDDK